MRIPTILLAAVLTAASTSLRAQSKSEMQASIAKLTAQNDSLSKQLTALGEKNVKYAKLIDTLSVMTGVHVDDLDTVKTVMQLRAAANTANVDSLTRLNARAARLQLDLDSVNTAYARLQEDCGAARAAVASGTAGTATVSKSDQLMKLNSMLEQGLITKEEFLKLKDELMKK
ncbi:MAG: SHOCT domain-containing protein [Flavobacteriales bacterium]|nr:SHOCT domain-containing protein [Flavobacteriales bacterium]